jgi:hypothetical protein
VFDLFPDQRFRRRFRESTILGKIKPSAQAGLVEFFDLRLQVPAVDLNRWRTEKGLLLGFSFLLDQDFPYLGLGPFFVEDLPDRFQRRTFGRSPPGV